MYREYWTSKPARDSKEIKEINAVWIYIITNVSTAGGKPKILAY